MEGGELFTSIQERADNAFNERGMYMYSTYYHSVMYLQYLLPVQPMCSIFSHFITDFLGSFIDALGLFNFGLVYTLGL